MWRTRSGRPVELCDCATGDGYVSGARDAVDPQGIGALADFVEHGRVGGIRVDLTLEYFLVGATIVLARGADLDLDAEHAGIGVDDQRPDVLADVQHHGLGMAPTGVILPDRLMAVAMTGHLAGAPLRRARRKVIAVVRSGYVWERRLGAKRQRRD